MVEGQTDTLKAVISKMRGKSTVSTLSHHSFSVAVERVADLFPQLRRKMSVRGDSLLYLGGISVRTTYSERLWNSKTRIGEFPDPFGLKLSLP